jgi:hypothetical protein
MPGGIRTHRSRPGEPHRPCIVRLVLLRHVQPDPHFGLQIADMKSQVARRCQGASKIISYRERQTCGSDVAPFYDESHAVGALERKEELTWCQAMDRQTPVKLE